MSNLWIDITSDTTVTLFRPNVLGKGHRDTRVVLTSNEVLRLADYLNMWIGRLDAETRRKAEV